MPLVTEQETNDHKDAPVRHRRVPIKIVYWQTSDGLQHDSQYKANRHQLKLDLAEWLRVKGLAGALHVHTAEELIHEWAINYKDDIDD